MISSDGLANSTDVHGSFETVKSVNLQDFPVRELLVSPNQDSANQTVIEHLNGGSQMFETRLNQTSLQQYLEVEQLDTLKKADRWINTQFRTLQKWEGYVIEVGAETFRAKVVALLGESSDMEADIYLEEIGEEDYALIKPGAVFYWSIGYLDGPSGRRRESIIRFRRLKTVTKRDLQQAESEAKALRSLFNEG